MHLILNAMATPRSGIGREFRCHRPDAKRSVHCRPALPFAVCVPGRGILPAGSSAFGVAKLALADGPPLLLLTVAVSHRGRGDVRPHSVAGIDWHLSRRDTREPRRARDCQQRGLSRAELCRHAHGLVRPHRRSSSARTRCSPSLVAATRPRRADNGARRPASRSAVGGVALNRRQPGSMSAREHWCGSCSLVGGLVSLVAGTILFKRLAPKGGLLLGNGVQNLAGAVALAPFRVRPRKRRRDRADLAARHRPRLPRLAGSVCGYLIWFHRSRYPGQPAASATIS